MQLYRDLSVSICFEVLRKTVVAELGWLFDMRKLTVSKYFSTVSLIVSECLCIRLVMFFINN